MKNSYRPAALAAALVASPATAFTSAAATNFQPLDFSGPQTPLTMGGKTVGTSFGNIYGDGSDAMMNVSWNPYASSGPGLFWGGPPGDDEGDAPAEQEGPAPQAEIRIYNALSQDPAEALSGHAGSLAIYFKVTNEAPDLMKPMTITMQFELYAHSSSGQALPMSDDKPFRFIERDVDGLNDGSLTMWEQISSEQGKGLSVLDPSFLTTFEAPPSIVRAPIVDVDPASGDIRGTAMWYEPTVVPTFNLSLHFSAGVSVAEGLFIFDSGTQAVPEPASGLLLGIAAPAALFFRRRRGKD